MLKRKTVPIECLDKEHKELKDLNKLLSISNKYNEKIYERNILTNNLKKIESANTYKKIYENDKAIIGLLTIIIAGLCFLGYKYIESKEMIKSVETSLKSKENVNLLNKKGYMNFLNNLSEDEKKNEGLDKVEMDYKEYLHSIKDLKSEKIDSKTLLTEKESFIIVETRYQTSLEVVFVILSATVLFLGSLVLFPSLLIPSFNKIKNRKKTKEDIVTIKQNIKDVNNELDVLKESYEKEWDLSVKEKEEVIVKDYYAGELNYGNMAKNNLVKLLLNQHIFDNVSLNKEVEKNNMYQSFNINYIYDEIKLNIDSLK